MKLLYLPYKILFAFYCFYKKYSSGFYHIENLYNNVLPAGSHFLEAIALFELAKKAKYSIVELGAYAGNSAVILAEGSGRGNKQFVYSVDPHTAVETDGHHYYNTKQLFEMNILKTYFAYLIKPIYRFSFEAVKDFKEKIGLLFIDTSSEFAWRDFTQWSPLVVAGGIILIRGLKREATADFIRKNILVNPAYGDLGVVQDMQLVLKKW